MFEPTSANMSLYDLWILVAITAPLALIITAAIFTIVFITTDKQATGNHVRLGVLPGLAIGTSLGILFGLLAAAWFWA